MGEPIHNCFNFTKIMVSRDVDDIEQLSLNSHTTTFLEVFSVCGIFPVLDFHCMWDFPWGTGFVCGFSKFVGFSLCVGFALYVCFIFPLCMCDFPCIYTWNLPCMWDLACMCLGDLPHVFYMYCPLCTPVVSPQGGSRAPPRRLCLWRSWPVWCWTTSLTSGSWDRPTSLAPSSSTLKR